MSTIHLLIKGKVQGVFYRASAKKEADTQHLSGWVQNTAEGDVEITVTGSTEGLQKFVDWCKKSTVNAHVTSVTIREIEERSFANFRIIR